MTEQTNFGRGIGERVQGRRLARTGLSNQSNQWVARHIETGCGEQEDKKVRVGSEELRGSRNVGGAELDVGCWMLEFRRSARAAGSGVLLGLHM